VPAGQEGWPLIELAATERFALLRGGLFLFVAAATIASLVLSLPVTSYFRSADYAASRFDYEILGVLAPAQLEALRRIPGTMSVTGFLEFSPAELDANGRSAGTSLLLTSEPENLPDSWFVDEAVIERSPATGNWVDVTADVAATLGVHAGDQVTTPLGGHPYAATVRRVLALDHNSFPAAIGPLTPEARELIPDDPLGASLAGSTADLVTTTLVRTSASLDQVRSAVSSAPKAESIVVQRRSEIAEHLATADPLSSMPTIVAATALGIAALLGLAIREGAALVRRQRRELAIFVALGASPGRVVEMLIVLEGSVALAASVSAGAVVVLVAYRGLLAPALPPLFVGPLALALGVATVAYVLTLGAATRRALRATKLTELLAAGTVR
jgi:hypothetical protein